MKSLIKQIAVCTFGTMLEWYDFSIFAALTPIISEVFFPQSNHFSAMMFIFLVFASGFIMRPIGAIFFGHLGDKIGRKSTLIITVILMTISTTAIGFLPVGPDLSLIALLICRLTQGFAASGEYPGGISLLAEQSNVSRRGFITSFGIFAAPAGIFMGTLFCTILSGLMDHENMVQWGWRIPFLIAAPFGLIVYLVRTALLESAAFQLAQKEKILTKIPVFYLIKKHYREFIALVCLYTLGSVAFYVNFVYLSNYSIAQHKFAALEALYLNSITTFVYAFSILLFGLFSDYLGRKFWMSVACLLLACLIYPLFLFILHGNIITQFVAQSFIALIIGMFVGPLAILSADFFPTQVRYTGISLSLNISAAIFGGSTPFVCAWLTKISDTPLAPAYYLIAIAVVTLWVLKNMKQLGGI